MDNFTPVSAFFGGVLIGLSVVVLLLTNGRIAGVSGVVSGLLVSRVHDAGWRLAFILGLIAAPLLYAAVAGGVPPIAVTSSTGLLIAAGLLVGFGARLGSGCTSGHGVAGIARLSPRSFVATGVFLTAGMVTVFVTRHVMGG
ncbi:YeeE/YedE family protein [Paeniroseomonas aquatica]|uniref:YeeE/YedE family protein n=1 Tax=Paeniroseomonas aquatica TaxID=373043 RepID=A0ABT8A1A5_9PROT|nr:YeeE/YedE family protein [Paeniroseomonas aquatica]MDN3563514.1 YeeE/YedE family protein [Paeniroseomonas aquatica]